MKKFKIAPDDWNSLETIAGRMKGEYPYYFLMCAKGEKVYEWHHGYEVVSKEDELGFLKSLSKSLRYKGMKTKPDWWP